MEPITIFGKASCGYCRRAKELCENKGSGGRFDGRVRLAVLAHQWPPHGSAISCNPSSGSQMHGYSPHPSQTVCGS